MKITDFSFLGSKGNILNPNDWLKLILGSAVTMVALGAGGLIAKKLNAMVPMWDFGVKRGNQPQAKVVKQRVVV